MEIVKRSDYAPMLQLVLDGLDSPRSREAYGVALSRFIGWYEEAGCPGFSKRLVQRYRQGLIESDLAPATVNLHLSAVRLTNSLFSYTI